jgi:hypothetical protein
MKMNSICKYFIGLSFSYATSVSFWFYFVEQSGQTSVVVHTYNPSTWKAEAGGCNLEDSLVSEILSQK